MGPGGKGRRDCPLLGGKRIMKVFNSKLVHNSSIGHIYIILYGLCCCVASCVAVMLNNTTIVSLQQLPTAVGDTSQH